VEEMFSTTFRVAETFLPDVTTAVFDRYFALYKELREDLKALNQKIFRFLR